jgi:hypothetical protein
MIALMSTVLRALRFADRLLCRLGRSCCVGRSQAELRRVVR